MREVESDLKMAIPVIHIDICPDNNDREVELLNNNNNSNNKVINESSTDSYSDELNSISLANQPLIFIDNGVKGPSKSGKTTVGEKDTFRPLKREESFPKKRPCRKNGLGLPSIYQRQELDMLNSVTSSVSPKLCLDTTVSESETDSVTPESLSPERLTPEKLTPTRTLRHLNVYNGETPDPMSRLSPYSPMRLSPSSGQDTSYKTNNDLDEVKQTATRLNLPTRRPSYVAWHDKYVKRPLRVLARPNAIPENEDVDVLTPDRRERINDSLEWIKTELMEMRSQDKELARQLLSLRKDINKFKLQKSCQEHEDLLDDAQDELAELSELSEMCDFPLSELSFGSSFSPLKQIGVTRLNISARRFSTC